MDWESLMGLLVVAAAAGWIDAVVGGGGLIQIPALMLAVPAASPVIALGTNKLAAICGTTSAAISYSRRTKLNWRWVAPTAAMAVVSAGLGALAASSIPGSYFRPVTMALLLLVLAFVVLRPSFGTVSDVVDPGRRKMLIATLLCGVVIGFYDGVFGPGTGTFLIISMVALLATNFVESSAMAKVVNAGTNLGALVVFAVEGQVLWKVGLGMAVCNVIGARLGARTALKRGAGFVRIVLVVVVIGMVLRLASLYIWPQ
jgi:uncharacterized membrane protein YfcA